MLARIFLGPLIAGPVMVPVGTVTLEFSEEQA